MMSEVDFWAFTSLQHILPLPFQSRVYPELTMATEQTDAHPTEPNDNLGPLADDEEIGPDGKRNKRKERLEQNRISARESRKRKKTMIEELQRTVITLSRDNKDLNDRNEALRRQLMEIGTKVRSYIPCRSIYFTIVMS
jgi:bZIP transcription factor